MIEQVLGRLHDLTVLCIFLLEISLAFGMQLLSVSVSILLKVFGFIVDGLFQ